MEVIWTDYIKYKAKLHGFDLDKIGNILKILVGAILRYYDWSSRCCWAT